MPTNFTGTLDTATPNIPTYGDAGGNVVPGYDIGTALETVGKVFESFAEQKRANQESAVIAGTADAFLAKRGELLDGLADISASANDLLNDLNPADAASIKVFQEKMRVLNSQSRQLRRDNSAQVLSLTRQAINQNPQLTEKIISASKGSEDLFSNVFTESDSATLVDQTDAKYKYAAQINDLVAVTGLSVAGAQAIVRNEQKIKADEVVAQGARLRGESMLAHGITYADTLRVSGIQAITINASRASSKEAARAEAYRVYQVRESKLNQWILDQQANGVIFQQQDLGELRMTLTKELSQMMTYAENVFDSTIGNIVKEKPDAGTFLYNSATAEAATSAYLAEGNSYMASFAATNPKLFMEKYYKPLEKVIVSLRGVDFAKLQKVAQGTGDEAADARSKLQAFSQYVRIEQASSFNLNTPEGERLAKEYSTIIDSVHNRTFDPAKIPKGSVSEMLMVEGLFNSKDKTPAAVDAQGQVITYNYKSSGVGPNYEQGINTQRRLLYTTSFVDWLSNPDHAGQRATLINNIQNDMMKFASENPEVLNSMKIDKASLEKADWRNEQPVFKNAYLAARGRGNFELLPEDNAQVADLNMRYRLLVRWSDSPEEALQWFNENVIAQRDAK